MSGTDVAVRPAVTNVKIRPGTDWTNLALSLALAFAIVAVYLPVHHYPFVDIDDDAYVYKNAQVTGPLNLDTVRYSFAHFYCDNYVPVDFLSHNLDVQMFGLNAGGHHDVNVLLHAVNAILLFWILKRATGYTARSWMVAALFALHPFNVENVAWIAERKTMLSTLFFLLAIVAYRWYAASPQLRRMAVVWVLYLLALLAKPQAIALPFVLLLWDYWPLRRMSWGSGAAGITPNVAPVSARKFSALVEEKLPLFATALLDAALTMQGEKGAAALLHLPLYIRLGSAVRSYGIYMAKAFWPSHLNLMPLHPGYSLSWSQVAMALVVLCGLSAWILTHRKYGYLVVGWLWFLGTMVPTIGIVQIQVAAWDDRYAYIAYMGLFIMCCWGIADMAERYSMPRPVLPVASLAVLLALSVATRQQVEVWKDSFTLWTHVLEVSRNHRNWVADARLGSYYFHQNQDEQALLHYSRAAEDRPDDFGILTRLAVTEHRLGNLKQALAYYQRALAVSRDNDLDAQFFANMGHVYDRLGDSANALRCYRSAQGLSASTTTPAEN